MMTTDQAAAYLGLAVRTLENKRTLGNGPRFTKRGRVFYDRADLDDWLKGVSGYSTAEVRKAVEK